VHAVFLVAVPCELAHCQPRHDRELVGDASPVTQWWGYVSGRAQRGDRVGPVEHDESLVSGGGPFQRAQERRDVGVKPAADVLHVVDDGVEVVEQPFELAVGHVSEALDRQARPAVDRVVDSGAALDAPADSVFRGEQSLEHPIVVAVQEVDCRREVLADPRRVRY